MPKILSILLIVVGCTLVAGVGYMLFSVQNDKNEADFSPEISQSEFSATQEQVADNNQSTLVGSYVDYSEEQLISTSGNRVLFFHAPWCSQCRELDSSIKAGAIPNDTTIFKVDYDSNQSLRQRYGVTIQTTVVLLDSDGNASAKYVAYEDPSLNSIVKGLNLQ